jgi:parvulin-like peptidyl-prolyl isomerase
MLSSDFQIDEEQLNQNKEQGKLVIFNSEKHKTGLARKLLKLKAGRKKIIDQGYYKNLYQVLSKQSIPHYRVRYIFIDKAKFETEEKLQAYLKKVRNLLEKTAFKSVAMQYSMDYKKHVGGDSGWFKEGKTDPVFFREVTANDKLAEEIFEFEANNAYYFAVKTHAKMDIEEVLVLQTKEQ